MKTLGSVVIGEGGPGSEAAIEIEKGRHVKVERESQRTLEDANFVTGDYISCAILPPLPNGSVAPAANVWRDPPLRINDGRAHPYRGFPARGNGFGGDGRGVVAGRGDGFPSGEWKRGEPLRDGKLRARGQ